MKKQTMREKKGSNQCGIFVGWLALALVPLLLVGGLLIDGGRLFVAKARLQNAVDGGALHGAFLLAEGKDRDSVKIAAADLALRNALDMGMNLAPQDVQVEVSSYRVTVVASADVELLLMRLFPAFGQWVRASARAVGQGVYPLALAVAVPRSARHFISLNCEAQPQEVQARCRVGAETENKCDEFCLMKEALLAMLAELKNEEYFTVIPYTVEYLLPLRDLAPIEGTFNHHDYTRDDLIQKIGTLNKLEMSPLCSQHPTECLRTEAVGQRCPASLGRACLACALKDAASVFSHPALPGDLIMNKRTLLFAAEAPHCVEKPAPASDPTTEGYLNNWVDPGWTFTCGQPNMTVGGCNNCAFHAPWYQTLARAMDMRMRGIAIDAIAMADPRRLSDCTYPEAAYTPPTSNNWRTYWAFSRYNPTYGGCPWASYNEGAADHFNILRQISNQGPERVYGEDDASGHPIPVRTNVTPPESPFDLRFHRGGPGGDVARSVCIAGMQPSNPRPTNFPQCMCRTLVGPDLKAGVYGELYNIVNQSVTDYFRNIVRQMRDLGPKPRLIE